MIRLEIKSEKTTTRNWNDRATGQPRSMELQEILLYLPNAEGISDSYDRIDTVVDNQEGPLKIGNYTLTPSCLYLDRNRRLSVSLRNLKRINDQKAS